MEILHTLREQFLQTTILEWFASISAFLCIYLATKEHISNWPVSILSILAYAYLFYNTRLYGEVLLQLYFLITAIYGWFYWIKIKTEEKIPVVKYGRKEMSIALLIMMCFAVILGTYMHHYTDNNVSYIDGTLASASFVAQFLMTRKVLQNWLIWLIADILYVPLFLYKGLILTALLYLVLAFLAWQGYKKWTKRWKENPS